MTPSRDISRLIEIMAALRDPVSGCPWDLEQTFETIRHYTIEEAYEVAEAIDRKDREELRDELGDLLLQPVYLAQLAAEEGSFSFGDVVEAVTTKLIRRHPHVFGDLDASNGAEAKARWDAIKAEERAIKAARLADRVASLLDDVPYALPALARAEKLAKRAATVGFDWPDADSVAAKVEEELDEVRDAARTGKPEKLSEEIGDLLFAVANLARHHGIDPEAALRDANAKFTRRFTHVETRAREDGIPLAEAGLERLDKYWNEIRERER